MGKNVELIVKARDQASKALDAINSILGDLVDTQQSASGSSKKTGSALKELGDSVSALKQELSGLDRASTSLKSLSSQKKEADQLQVSLDKTKADLADLKKEMSSAAGPAAKLKAEFESNNTRLTSLQRSYKNTGATIKNLKAALTENRQALREQKKALKDASEPTKAMKDSVAANQKVVDSLARKLKNAQTRYKSLSAEIKPLKQVVKESTSEYKKSEANISVLEEKIKGTEASVFSLSRSLDKLNKTIAEEDVSLKQAGVDTEKLASEQDRLTKATQRANLELAKSQARREALLKVQSPGGIPGRTQTTSLAGADFDTKFASTLSKGLSKVKATAESLSTASRAADQLKASISKLEVMRDLARDLDSQKKSSLEAYKAWKQLEAQVKQNAKEFNRAEVPTAEMAAALEKSKVAAQQAKAVYLQQRQVLAQSINTLNNAGVSTSNYAKAEETLTSKILKGTRALKDLTSALSNASRQTKRVKTDSGAAATEIERLGADTKKAAAQFRSLYRESRQSMSILQRLRGQVLSIASAYVGLYGAINGVQSVIQTFRDLQRVQNKFAVVFQGDQKKIQEELTFTREAADVLGLDYLKLANTYADFAVSTQGTNLEGRNTRAIFLAMAEAARSLNLPVEDLDGSFKALTQIASKGQLQLEELKGQLGDRLPGAVQIMSAAMAKYGIKTTKDLFKEIQKGNVNSSSLVAFADEIRKKFGSQLGPALNGIDAQIYRLGNTWLDFKVTIGNSGFIAELARALQEANEALKSEKAQEGAKKLGQILGSLVRGFIWLLENMDKVEVALKTLAALVGLSIFAKFGKVLYDIGRGFVYLVTWATKAVKWIRAGGVAGATAGRQFLLMGTRLLGIVGVIIAVGSAIYSLSSYLYDSNTAFREYVRDIQRGGIQLYADIRSLFKRIGLSIKNDLLGAWDDIKNGFADILEVIGQAYLKLGKTAKGTELLARAGEIRKGIDESRKGYSKAVKDLEAENAAYVNAQLGALEARFNKEDIDRKLKETKDKIVKNNKDITDQLNKLRDQAKTDLTGVNPLAGGGPTEDQIDRVLERVKKIKRSIQDVEEELLSDRFERATSGQIDEIVKERNKNLQDQLNNIEQKYQKLISDLNKIGKGSDSSEVQAVKTLIGLEQERAKLTERKKVEQLAEQRINDLISRRTALYGQINDVLESGGSDEAVANLRKEVQGLEQDLGASLDQAIKLAEQLGDRGKVLALQELKHEAENYNKVLIDTESINDALAQGAQTAFQSVAESLAGVISNTSSWKDLLGSVRNAFLTFAADFLQKIAEMIFQQVILNALQSSGYGGAIAGVANAVVGSNHTGGMAGTGAKRSVPAGIFSNARRLHTGGMLGLGIRPGEVPVIMKTDEEVLTRDDPRHVLNGGGGSQQQPPIYNILDTDSMTQAIVQNKSFGKGILNYISANKQAVKKKLE